MAQNQTEATIVNGPSKFDLMLALFDWSPRRSVEFEIIHPVGSDRKLRGECYIYSVEVEDGSGDSWNITGKCESKNFKAYFNTKTRKGHMRF